MLYPIFTESSLQRSNKLPIDLLNLLNRSLITVIILQPLRIRRNLRIYLLLNDSSTDSRNNRETHQHIRRIEFGTTQAPSLSVGSTRSRLELTFQEGEVDSELLVEESGLNLVGDHARDWLEEERKGGITHGYTYHGFSQLICFFQGAGKGKNGLLTTNAITIFGIRLPST